MIEKIRWRFVAIAMGSLFVVMVLIIGGINAYNFKSVNDFSDTVLCSLADNGGSFSAFSGTADMTRPPRSDEMTAETQFETRYFTVTYNSTANVALVDISHIAAVDKNTAYNYAAEVLLEGKVKGYNGVYRYLVRSVNDATTMVLFVDSSRQLAIAQEFLRMSLLIAFSVLADRKSVV